MTDTEPDTDTSEPSNDQRLTPCEQARLSLQDLRTYRDDLPDAVEGDNKVQAHYEDTLDTLEDAIDRLCEAAAPDAREVSRDG